MSADAPVYLVTAAGRGIGAGCARALADAGARLVLLSPSGSAETLAQELGVIGMTGSITVPADLAAFVDLAQRSYGRIDGAVVNTGIVPSSLRVDGTAHASGSAYDPTDMTQVAEIDDADWQQGFEMMFLGVTRLVREMLPVLRDGGGGSVVAISTFTAPEPRVAYPVASCMRAALGALVKLYADRYARDAIRFNAILPGFIDNWDQPQDVIDAIPIARLGTVDEVAGTVRFLMSRDAGYITGQSILVDGGVNRAV